MEIKIFHFITLFLSLFRLVLLELEFFHKMFDGYALCCTAHVPQSLLAPNWQTGSATYLIINKIYFQHSVFYLCLVSHCLLIFAMSRLLRNHNMCTVKKRNKIYLNISFHSAFAILISSGVIGTGNFSIKCLTALHTVARRMYHNRY